ncbi:triose-phosphate isomerase [Rhodothermus marinus]|jgi:triosephosphate isomerase|uniref:triose-phosphate isomerase n=1 Tax=Rhodothermus marinus TaxID=29549 RepID=UPI001E03F703|nr:triose-phosphate isomerase [Rhodothermus marinus]MBO2491251.1 triose-phosphate isomerase [Rhodothermus marinus]
MLVAGNWKMHTDREEAIRLAEAVVAEVGDPGPVQVAVCPPFVNLEVVRQVIEGTPIRLGAQNMHYEEAGAYTGEVSAPMLKSVGCRYVILGHSERRQYFGETDEGVNRKIKRALQYELIPIVCVGETLEERQAGQAAAVVERQVRAALDGVALHSAEALVIAYEPVWAIGTGHTATPEQAQEMHALIRRLLIDRYGEAIGRALHILYGGSVKPGNAADLFAQPDVDGGLIGGASLKAADFAAIVRAAHC